MYMWNKIHFEKIFFSMCKLKTNSTHFPEHIATKMNWTELLRPNMTIAVNGALNRETFQNECRSLQFRPLPDWAVRGTWGTIQQRAPCLWCRRTLWAVLARAGMSTFWHCLSSIIVLCRTRRPPSSKVPEGWFWRGCHGVWHALTIRISVSWYC